MRILNSLRHRLLGEQGSTIPEVMIAVIASAAVLGVIAGGIVSLSSLFTQTATAAASINEVSTATMRWRADVHDAVGITAQNSTAVIFVVPAAAGACRSSAWTATASGLAVTTTSYPALAGTACSGTAGAATTEQLLRAGSNASFSYKNAGGRAITFTSGTATLDTVAVKPATVTQAAWDGKTVAAATLQATPTYPTSKPRTIDSSQVASTVVAAGSATATAASKQVQPLTAGQSLLLAAPMTDTAAGAGGTAGYSDGTSAQPVTATFSAPRRAVVDSTGSIYVLDTGNNKIRKITSAGVVSTYAGSSTNAAGATNGTGTAALFKGPQGIALGADGTTLYVADTGNNKIRKVAAGGVVTDVAGSGAASSTDSATPTAATFNAPQALVVAPDGIVYVGDTGGNKIRAISTSLAVTTVAGTGSAGAVNGTGTTSVTFNGISGMALDAAGTNLYVTETGNNDIRQIVIATKGVTTLAGGTAGYADGTGSAAKFSAPKGITVVGGTLFVADSGNNRIRSVTAAGVVATLTGATTAGAANGTTATTQFSTPSGVSAGPNGSLLVADTGNNQVRSIR